MRRAAAGEEFPLPDEEALEVGRDPDQGDGRRAGREGVQLPDLSDHEPGGHRELGRALSQRIQQGAVATGIRRICREDRHVARAGLNCCGRPAEATRQGRQPQERGGTPEGDREVPRRGNGVQAGGVGLRS